MPRLQIKTAGYSQPSIHSLKWFWVISLVLAPAALAQDLSTLWPSFGTPSQDVRLVEGEDGLAVVVDGSPSCGGECGGTCNECQCCARASWCRRIAVWAEALALRPRDVEVPIAVVSNAPATVQPLQRSALSVLDLDYQYGGRVGADYFLNACTKVGASYTYFESAADSQLQAQAAFQIASLLTHPGVLNAQGPYQQANGSYKHSYHLADITYERLLYYDERQQLGYVLGLRGAQHEQNMTTLFQGQVNRTITTDIDFMGLGPRAGLEGIKYITCRWNVYSKVHASILPGEFEASFTQTQAQAGTEVATSWNAGRVVGIWDLEFGTGWTSKCGFYHLSLGYVFSAWTNVVQTDEWVQSVRMNSYVDMSSTSTYDGLVARAEVRF